MQVGVHYRLGETPKQQTTCFQPTAVLPELLPTVLPSPSRLVLSRQIPGRTLTLQRVCVKLQQLFILEVFYQLFILEVFYQSGE